MKTLSGLSSKLINGRGLAAVFWTDDAPIPQFLKRFHPDFAHSQVSRNPDGRWFGIGDELVRPSGPDDQGGISALIISLPRGFIAVVID